MIGRFITFEGGEGAGKSSQIKRLASRLSAAGLRTLVTREPGGTPLAEAIRSFVLAGEGTDLGPDGEATLMAAARADHVVHVIRPALAAGAWVLCDRFADSTRVYQGGPGGADQGLIAALERAAVGTTKPDVTIVLDVPVTIGLARRAARDAGEAPGGDRFERDGIVQHEARRQAFLAIARAEPQRCVVVDGSRSEADVAEAVWAAVNSRLYVGAG